jgi:TRAP-type C4-dicarboxylate transport system permease small subunit
VETLKRISYGLAAAGLAASVLLALTEVLARYFLGVSHSSALEVMQWLLVVGVLLCAGPALDDGLHVGVDQLIRQAPPPLRRLADLVTGLAGVVFAVALAWQGLGFVGWAIRLNEQSLTEVQLPMAVPYAFIPLGACLLLLFQLARLLRRARRGAR